AHRVEQFDQRDELAVREDVARNEPAPLWLDRGFTDDRLREHGAAGSDQRTGLREEGGQVGGADVLDHLDARQPVVRTVVDLSPIAESNLASVAEAGGSDPMSSLLGL